MGFWTFFLKRPISSQIFPIISFWGLGVVPPPGVHKCSAIATRNVKPEAPRCPVVAIQSRPEREDNPHLRTDFQEVMKEYHPNKNHYIQA
eukprot:317909-Amphidinium_carterae.1